MANFVEFAQAVEARLKSMSERELFVVDLGDIDLFDVYLNAFPEGSNPIFRQRTEHDCSCCKQFVRNLGHVVAISDDGGVHTVWACGALPEPYATVARKLDEHVRALPIQTVFRTTESRFGISHNYDKATDQRWNHFVGHVEAKHKCKDPGAQRSAADATAQVLRRGLDELSVDALDTVVDLIESNTLYRGEEHKAAVVAFRQLHRAFPRTSSESEKAAFVWCRLEDRAARFRNTVIGTLVTDLSSGMDAEQAIKAFETKVAPTNYKRPTALITPRMIDDAVATIEALGLTSALKRRYAKITDVSVNNVLWVDNAVRGQMRDGLAGLLMEEIRAVPVNIKDAEQISADDFVARDLTVEQLFDLPLIKEGGADLDTIARGVYAELKGLSEGSFVEVKPDPRKAELETRLEIVKHIIAIKQAEGDAIKRAAARQEERRKILDAINAKRDQELTAASMDDLLKRLSALDT